MLGRSALLAPLAVGLATSGAVADPPSSCRIGSRPMARADLFFGASATPAASWRRFLKIVVTPRFPDGLTSLEGRGQWRGSKGLAREATRVLVIVYEADATSDARLETIRSVYKREFAQTSVMRIDTTVCASF